MGIRRPRRDGPVFRVPRKPKLPRVEDVGRSIPKRVLRMGLVVLMLGVIAFSLYQCAQHVTSCMDTLRTQRIEESSFVQLDMYLFRDETPVDMNGNVFLYSVGDGERVGVGDTVAMAYTATSGADELQAQLDACTARLEALKAKKKTDGAMSDVSDVLGEIDENYIGILGSAADGRVGQAYEYADGMLDALNRYAVLTGSGSGGEQLSESKVKKEQETIVSGLPLTDTLTADTGAYFYHTIDGYETVFDYDAVMTMTLTDFFRTVNAEASPVSDRTAGKLVMSTLWYGVAYVPLADSVHFDVGDKYDMRFSGSTGVTISMKVERILPDAEGALLVFSSSVMPDGFDFDRRMTAETVVSETSGYRIPTEALVTRYDSKGREVTGVYILTGNVVEFRLVDVKAERTGYYIAYTYAEITSAREEAEAAGLPEPKTDWPYLQDNDRIIIGSEAVYEGQMFG